MLAGEETHVHGHIDAVEFGDVLFVQQVRQIEKLQVAGCGERGDIEFVHDEQRPASASGNDQ